MPGCAGAAIWLRTTSAGAGVAPPSRSLASTVATAVPPLRPAADPLSLPALMGSGPARTLTVTLAPSQIAGAPTAQSV